MHRHEQFLEPTWRKWLALHSDDGNLGGPVCSDLKAFTLPAGTYTVRVYGQGPAGNYSFSVTSVPGAISFPIALGDKVTPGQPGPGAGEITAAAEVDLYTFSLAQPQVVYLDAQGDCASTLIRWTLLGPTGATVKSDSGEVDSAVCFDLGLYTLPAGSYTIRVNTTSGLGTYGFQVWAVAATATFAIAVGETVSSGQPAAGAGEITTAGETDLYTFSLASPQVLYLDAQGDCGGTLIRWALLGSDGAEVRSGAGILIRRRALTSARTRFLRAVTPFGSRRRMQ